MVREGGVGKVGCLGLYEGGRLGTGFGGEGRKDGVGTRR